MLLHALCIVGLSFAVLVCLVSLYHRLRRRNNVWAFFHPYCSSGGGGERVLWKMIQVLGTLVERGFSLQVVVFTIDAPGSSYKQDLLRHVQERFDISVSAKLDLKFIHLDKYKDFLKPAKRFSLLVESIGTARLAFQGYRQLGLTPDVFLDTTGCAFTFVVAKIFGSAVVPYVHYPTISTDMLQVVWERRPPAYSQANESSSVKPGRLSSAIKLVYYLLFAALYGMVGSLSTFVLVNSTWTCNHIRSLWKGSALLGRIRILYPPCRVPSEKMKPSKRDPVILSIGQFRPEKDHVLQLKALSCLRKKYPKLKVKLVLLGSCRGESDNERLRLLQSLSQNMDLSEHVEFVVNQPYSVVEHWLRTAKVGLHTMWNEHFGIGIVEMMAAGLLVVAHNSGGPSLDIVKGGTGYLASTPEEYADALYHALAATDAATMQQAAIDTAQRFSDDVFDRELEGFLITSGLLAR